MRSPWASHALGALAVISRALSWALAALVAADALLAGWSRGWLLAVNEVVSQLIPALVRGLFVFPTFVGGAFRGDFALVAFVLIVLDWIFCRIAASLR
mgnify:CR=1